MCRVHGRSRAAGVTDDWRDLLEQPVSLEEVHIAVRKGGRNKASGSDGIGLQFYKANWAAVQDDVGAMMNQMFMDRKVSAQQKHGEIVCLLKSRDPITPADFRPITLLNTDYKIMDRTIAYRLCHMMEELLHPSKFCGVSGRTIFEAMATVLQAIAQAEVTRVPLCALFLDFQEGFDRISHQYIFTILRSYGFSDWFVERMKNMYEEAASFIQINGHVSGAIPIHSSVRQGCPMSMLLFALCVNTLFLILDRNLPVSELENEPEIL